MIKNRLNDPLCVISITVLCEEPWKIAYILWSVSEPMPSMHNLQQTLLWRIYVCVYVRKFVQVCLCLENLTTVYSIPYKTYSWYTMSNSKFSSSKCWAKWCQASFSFLFIKGPWTKEVLFIRHSLGNWWHNLTFY